MNTFTKMIAAVLVSASAQAQADGFVCTSESGTVVKVFNHTQPSKGTRTGAIMVVSDSSVGYGNKTIATFKETDGLLTSKELAYIAKVDLRFKDSSRKGELIAGTKLGELKTIQLHLNFSYAHPIENGDLVSGRIYLNKRNDQTLSEKVSCARYLKN